MYERRKKKRSDILYKLARAEEKNISESDLQSLENELKQVDREIDEINKERNVKVEEQTQELEDIEVRFNLEQERQIKRSIKFLEATGFAYLHPSDQRWIVEVLINRGLVASIFSDGSGLLPGRFDPSNGTFGESAVYGGHSGELMFVEFMNTLLVGKQEDGQGGGMTYLNKQQFNGFNVETDKEFSVSSEQRDVNSRLAGTGMWNSFTGKIDRDKALVNLGIKEEYNESQKT